MSEENLDPEDHKMFRQVVGKLLYAFEDCIGAQFTIQKLTTELQAHAVASMRRAKHLVRYLMG